jgi:6-pyruvoyltetrahydropterin/6-carboxytetrahydropterin synthase
MSKGRITYEAEVSYAHILVKDITSKCARLHGHNGKVTVILGGELIDGKVVDFNKLKDIIGVLDHKTILPTTLVHLQATSSPNYTFHTKDGKYYSLPKQDVILIPYDETTCENLASYLGDLIERTCTLVEYIAVEWSETAKSRAHSERSVLHGKC